MVLAFVVPIIGLFSGLSTFLIALTTLALMAFTYKPTISLYNLPSSVGVVFTIRSFILYYDDLVVRFTLLERRTQPMEG